MNLQAASSLLKGGRLRLLLSVNQLLSPFYRLSFLAAAASCGLLRLLAPSPRSLREICAGLSIDESMQGGLLAWLDLGVCLGELAKDADRYRLAGYLAWKLASPKYDEVAALVQEIVYFHHRLMLETPVRLQKKEPWRLAEHDGELIARSSRIMEPFVFGVIDWALPKSGPRRLLEVGCGAGTYMRYAVERNPELHAIGIDLDPAVAEKARQAVAKWGLEQRITVESVWESNAVGLGGLPKKSEVAEQLRAAGFVDVRVKRAIPGEPYYAFLARKPDPQKGQARSF